MTYIDKDKEKATRRANYARNKVKISAERKRSRLANKDAVLATERAYAEKNKERIKGRMKEWSKGYRERNKAILAAKKKTYYEANKERESIRRKNYRTNQMAWKDAIRLHYGCLNPDCQWVGGWLAYCLDFHHLESKSFNVSSDTSLKRAVQEINKCTILCPVCHRMVTNGDLDDKTFPRCQLDADGNIVEPS